MTTTRETTITLTCDRCSKSSTSGTNWLRIMRSKPNGQFIGAIDLCPACTKKFDEFLGEEGRVVDPEGAGAKEDCG